MSLQDFNFQFFLYFFLQTNLTHLPRSEFVPGIGLGIGKCPYDPIDNSTAIYVESGSPGGFPVLVREELFNEFVSWEGRVW